MTMHARAGAESRSLFAVLLAALAAMCWLPGAALAQNPAQGDLPPAEQIFERYIEAIGGREAVDGLTNRRITGTYKGAPFEYTARLNVWWERDGRFHQRVAEPGGIRYDLYVNGDRTWAKVLEREPAPITGRQRVELLDTSDFLGEANYKQRYKEIATSGRGKADGEDVWIVRAVTHANRPHTLFFSQKTGLLMGTRVPTTGEGGEVRDMMVRLLDYVDAGGVLYPTRIVQQFNNGEITNEYNYSDIKVNVDDGHEYSIPESIERVFAEAEAAAAEAASQTGG